MIKFTINTYNFEYGDHFTLNDTTIEINQFLDGDDTKIAFQSERDRLIVSKSDLKMILAALESS